MTIRPALLHELGTIDTATICNAIERFKVRDRTVGYLGMNVRCLFPEMPPMVGYALTVTTESTTPGPPPTPHGTMRMWEALAAGPKPTVLVMKSLDPSPLRSCFFGEVMANTARRLGCVGIVTDGGVRDFSEVRALGLPYFAAGLVASHGNHRIVEVGVPVLMGGTSISPGDLLHGDVNGVTTVPMEIAERLPEEVEKIRVMEQQRIALVNGPDFSLDALRKALGLYEGRT